MIKYNIFIFVLFITSHNFMAQNEYKDIIISNANQYCDAIIKNDFKKIVDYTYPELVKVINKDTLLNKLSYNMVSMKNEGLRYKSIKVENPQKIISPIDKLYYVIPRITVKYNSRGKFYIKSYLFSISNDTGKTWHFITNKQFEKYQNILFPEIGNKYTFPKESSIYVLNKNFNNLLINPSN